MKTVIGMMILFLYLHFSFPSASAMESPELMRQGRPMVLKVPILLCHRFWHPDFRIEKQKLTPKECEKFVQMQLRKSKETLEKELGVKVTMLVYDDDLIKKASQAGYVAAFTTERGHVSPPQT